MIFHIYAGLSIFLWLCCVPSIVSVDIFVLTADLFTDWPDEVKKWLAIAFAGCLWGSLFAYFRTSIAGTALSHSIVCIELDQDSLLGKFFSFVYAYLTMTVALLDIFSHILQQIIVVAQSLPVGCWCVAVVVSAYISISNIE